MAALDDLQKAVTGEEKTEDINKNQAAVPKPADGADAQFGTKVVTIAKTWLDVPYLIGGVTDKGIDAGGLLQVVYEKVSINFGTTFASSLYQLFNEKKLTYTNKSETKAGDVVFFQGTDGADKGVVSTMGILIGDDKFIHASSGEKKVVTTLLSQDYYKAHIYGYGRLSANGALSAAAQKTEAAAARKNASAAQDGFNVKMKPHAKHVDATIKKTPEGKTFCEPIYPDLVSVTSEAPKYLLDTLSATQISTMKQVEDGKVQVSNEELQTRYGIDLSSILGSQQEVVARQHIFDPESHKNTRKKPNPGKPANNNDAYPVDLKIEELELHAPRIKINELELCDVKGSDITLGKAILDVADRAEKRIVKLENMMATLQRNLFRMASRVNINCVYYGGQDKNQKYCSIRCLHDNRIEDGQCMSLDQCLNCTRYEPIFGQVYDILNDTGSNLAAILDDNQMAYMTMDDYIEGAKVDKFHEEMAKGKIEMASVKSRDLTAKDFKDYWPVGYKQDWTLVPVEQQKPGINWRQSLLDDGSKLSKLGSCQYAKGNYGRSGITLGAGDMKDIMKKHLDALNSNTVTSLQGYIDAAKSKISSGKAENTVSTMNSIGYENNIRNLCASKGLDPLLILALIVVESGGDPAAGLPDGGFWGCMQADYKEVSSAYSNFETLAALEQANAGIDVGTGMYGNKGSATASGNPLIVCTAYNAGQGIFVDGDINPLITETAANNIVDPTTGTTTQLFTWDGRETWSYPLIGEALLERVNSVYGSGKVDEVMEYFPMIVYAYDLLQSLTKLSYLNGAKFGFPIAQGDLENKGVYLTSTFGWREAPTAGASSNHPGVDIACGDAITVYSIGSGTVDFADAAGNAGNMIEITHADGAISQYMHLEDILIASGSTVAAGTPIATMGNSGNSTGRHLHFQINIDGSPVDPSGFFPQLNIAEGAQIS